MPILNAAEVYGCVLGLAIGITRGARRGTARRGTRLSSLLYPPFGASPSPPLGSASQTRRVKKYSRASESNDISVPSARGIYNGLISGRFFSSVSHQLDTGAGVAGHAAAAVNY